MTNVENTDKNKYHINKTLKKCKIMLNNINIILEKINI